MGDDPPGCRAPVIPRVESTVKSAINLIWGVQLQYSHCAVGPQSPFKVPRSYLMVLMTYWFQAGALPLKGGGIMPRGDSAHFTFATYKEPVQSRPTSRFYKSSTDPACGTLQSTCDLHFMHLLASAGTGSPSN